MVRSLESQEIAGLREGIAQFRAGEYFEAHDDWEEVWRELSGRRRLFWQAMIQLAVGTHHWENGNQRGCHSVWSKALQKCDDLGQLYDDEVPAPLFHLIRVLDEGLRALEQG
jgi:predicted metal-dependent hydrolase